MKNNSFNNEFSYNDSYNYFENEGVRVYSDSRDNYRHRTRRKKSRAGLVLTTVALTLAAVFVIGAVSVFAFSAAHGQNLLQTTASSTQKALPQTAASPDGNSDSSMIPCGDSRQADTASGDTLAMSIAKSVYAGHDLQQSDYSDRVILVDGDKVYMDTDHLPPANTGDPIHVSEFGKTAYGFNWTYSCDNDNFVMSCNYNFSQNQYDFVIYGTAPGYSTVTVYYNTADNQQATEQVNIYVDQNLNVTQL